VIDLTSIESRARAAEPPEQRPARTVQTRPRRHRVRWPFWFALPAIAVVGIFFIVPQFLNLRFAFSNWRSTSSAIAFNGLDNLEYLSDAGELWHGIQVTLIYAVIAMVLQNAISLVLAYALRESTRINGFFRTVFFVPVLLSPLAAGYVWRGLLTPDGPVNQLIGLVIPGFDWSWLGEPSTALFCVAFIDSWKWIGLTTLIYIAGMNLVSPEMIEASTLDGANAWQRFRHMIFPMLAPAFTYNTVVNLVAAFSAYDVIQAATGGGPGDATRAINIYLRLEWGQGNFGAGSALSLVVSALVVVFAIPLIWFLRRREVTQ
jgi:multiple sugar transport system permease protein/raffinose/stachyose/melibiose transport system permease protein